MIEKQPISVYPELRIWNFLENIFEFYGITKFDYVSISLLNFTNFFYRFVWRLSFLMTRLLISFYNLTYQILNKRFFFLPTPPHQKNSFSIFLNVIIKLNLIKRLRFFFQLIEFKKNLKVWTIRIKAFNLFNQIR